MVWTAGRIDKLAIYRRLGVTEVWFWRKGRITPYALHCEHYVPIAAIEVLPGLNLELLTSFLDNPTTFDAIRGFQAGLRAGAPRRSALDPSPGRRAGRPESGGSPNLSGAGARAEKPRPQAKASNRDSQPSKRGHWERTVAKLSRRAIRGPWAKSLRPLM